MTRFATAVIALFLATTSAAHAQTKLDEQAVHNLRTGAGVKNRDGTARQRRYGMMTMVAEKRTGSWLVVASQNDSSFPGLTPELERITLPMPIPNQVGPQPSN